MTNLTINKLIFSVLTLVGVSAIAAPAFAQICTIGERRVRENVVIADAFAEQCLLGPCERRVDRQTYNAPPGWAVVRYWPGTRHDRGRTTRSLSHMSARSHFISGQQFQNERQEMKRGSGMSLEFGGSRAAQAIESLHNQYRTSNTTIKLTVAAQGREARGGSSKREEALHVEEVCVGTIDDYRAALRQELEAARRQQPR
jgi:hypothetical protein